MSHILPNYPNVCCICNSYLFCSCNIMNNILIWFSKSTTMARPIIYDNMILQGSLNLMYSFNESCFCQLSYKQIPSLISVVIGYKEPVSLHSASSFYRPKIYQPTPYSLRQQKGFNDQKI